MTDDLISRAVAIEAFEKRFVSENGSLIALTFDGCKNVIENLPPAEPRWIPVTEHTLPNHNSVVVVCGKKGTWDFGTYRGLASTNINLWHWKKNTVKEVYWWMYKEDALPTPWRGESDG